MDRELNSALNDITLTGDDEWCTKWVLRVSKVRLSHLKNTLNAKGMVKIYTKISMNAINLTFQDTHFRLSNLWAIFLPLFFFTQCVYWCVTNEFEKQNCSQHKVLKMQQIQRKAFLKTFFSMKNPTSIVVSQYSSVEKWFKSYCEEVQCNFLLIFSWKLPSGTNSHPQ